MGTVIVLALLQGATEFLPVSSSGHLILAEHLLRYEPPGVALEIALHVGTLLAVLVYYRRRLMDMTVGVCRGSPEDWREMLWLFAGTVPAAAIGLGLRGWFLQVAESPPAAASCLVGTGVILLSVRWARRATASLTFPRAVGIGLAQAVAILPGISRSGATIAVARHLGVAPDKAAEFSFFLMIPAVAGGALVECREAGLAMAGIPPGVLLAGILVAAAAGYAALTLLVRTLRSDRFWLFGFYCLPAGLVALWLVR